MNTYGFKLDEFPGNFTVVLAKIEKTKVIDSNICPMDYALNDEQQTDWIVISPTDTYDPYVLDELAKKLSAQLVCNSIRIRFGDASGHLEYTLYSNGKVKEEYSFGNDYSDEMEEYGQNPREAKANETLIRADGFKYAYFSEEQHPSESEIKGGMEFLNKIFIELQAELSWDYCYQ